MKTSKKLLLGPSLSILLLIIVLCFCCQKERLNMKLEVLPYSLAIVKLDPKDKIPSWAFDPNFYSISRNSDELSIVCPEAVVPKG